ncbi:MAG: SRPBCC domain-containing protein [Pseudomonadota bacterium]
MLLCFTLLLSVCWLRNPSWEVEHQVDISASPAIVWNLLADLENYSTWNKYSPRVVGKLGVGEVVWVESHLDDEVQHVQNHVISIQENSELCWQSAGWYGVLVRGKRCRWLQELAVDQTRLRHYEIMSGPLAWLIEVLYRERIEAGIELADNSLAQYAEQLAKER